jgi:uncharacterized damage-inducible protein DinB
MKPVFLSAFFLSLCLSAGAIAASAQNSDASADHTPPSYDLKGQSLADLQVVQTKFVDLANALPAGKLTWRPSADSRSFAEVFLHVAGERYQILNLMGTELPAGFDGKTYEKSTTDKARIVEELNKSWDYAQKAINGMANADFARMIPKLGPQANAGDVIYILVADAHEHLGQVVAYARENGIVPPWTVEQQKKAAEAKAGKK